MRTHLAVAMAVAVLAGCGDDPGTPRLVVFAASSMSQALRDCAKDFRGAEVSLSLAGSDELAAQIRQGVKPGVYAAANTTLPEALAKEKRLSEPVEFASNELVLAVAAGEREVRDLDDLTASGVTIAAGSESVPVGSYTREVLSRLPPETERRILANIRSSEPDVKGVVGKLTQGATDAGFVYTTDVEATNGRLEAIELPARLEPEATYAAGTVTGTDEPESARRFVAGLRSGPCADALRRAGFGRPR